MVCLRFLNLYYSDQKSIGSNALPLLSQNTPQHSASIAVGGQVCNCSPFVIAYSDGEKVSTSHRIHSIKNTVNGLSFTVYPVLQLRHRLLIAFTRFSTPDLTLIPPHCLVKTARRKWIIWVSICIFFSKYGFFLGIKTCRLPLPEKLH